MEKVLEIATKVSTPIAVAGLVVGVLLIIFYAILKLKIFPKLNQTMGKDLITSMMKYLYTLAMVSIVLGFVGYLTPIVLGAIFPPNPRPPDSAKMPITYDITLKNAILEAAESDERTVKFGENCPDTALNTKVKKITYQGENYADIIYQLQHNLTEPVPQIEPNKDIYSVNLNNGGYYEIVCRN